LAGLPWTDEALKGAEKHGYRAVRPFCKAVTVRVNSVTTLPILHSQSIGFGDAPVFVRTNLLDISDCLVNQLLFRLKGIINFFGTLLLGSVSSIDIVDRQLIRYYLPFSVCISG
jgi:hypothetical protein